MAWIKEIKKNEAEGRLANIYGQLAAPDGDIDRILRVHSILPKTLKAHLQLYRNVVLSDSTLSRKYREMIAVVVSAINKCPY